MFLIQGWPDSLYVILGVAAFAGFCVWTHLDKRWHLDRGKDSSKPPTAS